MDGATPRWDDILAMAKAGEAVGFDTLWISDHLGFGDPAGEWSGAWESMTLLVGARGRRAAGPARHLRHGDAAAEPCAAREDGRDARRGQRRAVHPRPRRRLERARVHRVRRAVRAPLRRVRGGPADHRRDVPRRARGPRRDLVAGAARTDRTARSPAIGTADHDRDRRQTHAPAHRGAGGRMERGHAPARRAAADPRGRRRGLCRRRARPRDAGALGGGAHPDDRRSSRPTARGARDPRLAGRARGRPAPVRRARDVPRAGPAPAQPARGRGGVRARDAGARQAIGPRSATRRCPGAAASAAERAMQSASRSTCRPSSSKLSGRSQASKPRRRPATRRR